MGGMIKRLGKRRKDYPPSKGSKVCTSCGETFQPGDKRVVLSHRPGIHHPECVKR